VLASQAAAADPSKVYAVLMMDPDAPRHSQPLAAPYRHWLVVNIPGAALRAGDVGVGEGGGQHLAERARYAWGETLSGGLLAGSCPGYIVLSQRDLTCFSH
jgi:phosphatidylethanolamine-binding protein (PEBP) family uncharacterized protein